MGRQIVKDEMLRILGYIEPLDDGRLKGVDAQLVTVGYYDPEGDVTLDQDMRALGPGDSLSDLLFEADRRKSA